MTKQKTTPKQFEKSLSELEKIVDKMEQGQLPLEEALTLFERGVTLTRQCQTALKAAEQKVQILMDAKPDAALEPFYEDDDDS